MADVFLQPGEYHVGDAGCCMRTLLGSCVSVTLWHPLQKVGAMSHFLLPSRGGRRVLELDGRYGNEAMLVMLRELVRRGVDPGECEAKLFGGGNMFPEFGACDADQVGRRNGESARQLLTALRIPIVGESLFGIGHRQIIFEVMTGAVWARQRQPMEMAVPGARR